MRIEVNREVFHVEAAKVTGAYLRGVVGVPVSEDLYGKGVPRPGEEGDADGFLVGEAATLVLYEGQEFYTVARPTIFAGIPIQTDPDLAENQLKIIDSGGLEHIYEFDGDDLNEVTI